MPNSAFIVEVPEAEPYVARLRMRFDPSARLQAPAHVTVLYPFMSPELLSDAVLRPACAALATFSCFDFTLSKVKRFPGVLYLEVEPPAPFVQLTTTLSALFPAYPPHGGRHETVVPHLTVAQTEEPRLDTIEDDLRALLPRDGIGATCRRVLLIENASGRWRRFRAFDLRCEA